MEERSRCYEWLRANAGVGRSLSHIRWGEGRWREGPGEGGGDSAGEMSGSGKGVCAQARRCAGDWAAVNIEVDRGGGGWPAYPKPRPAWRCVARPANINCRIDSNTNVRRHHPSPTALPPCNSFVLHSQRSGWILFHHSLDVWDKVVTYHHLDFVLDGRHDNTGVS